MIKENACSVISSADRRKLNTKCRNIGRSKRSNVIVRIVMTLHLNPNPSD